jgi:regulator-associated protein of mTOR
MSPDLPADLFTSCLTTPITIALRWFVLLNPLIDVTIDMASKVPGRVTDRRTPLGELNWIFTSITDTIAWSVLGTDIFLSLFRNDLMVAALFRNFLLADRIMRHYNCHPMSSPKIPSAYQHPMWEVWDLAADQCLSQLPGILNQKNPQEYKLSSFFTDQLSAFEVWIKKGGVTKEPPLQLPIVLQVLLSQVHRLRALLLLSKFLDFGKWAVDLALSVGIYPYVLKLLQSPALELRPVLVFIWAKLLAVDRSSKYDLLKDNGYTYFLGILGNTNNTQVMVPNISEHRAMCVFILSVFCSEYMAGQQACLSNELLPALLISVQDNDSLLRQWSCICLCNFWTDFPDAKWAALNANAHSQLVLCLQDGVPEVRAAAICALGALFGKLERIELVLQLEQFIVVNVLKCIGDASPLVRKELAVAFSALVKQDEQKFLYTALDVLEDERRHQKDLKGASLRLKDSLKPFGDDTSGNIQQAIYIMVWKGLLALSVDPFPNVCAVAQHVVDGIYHKMIKSGVMDLNLSQYVESKRSNFFPVLIPKPSLMQFKNTRGTVTQASSGIFGMSLDTDKISIKRTSSFVLSLKSIGSLVGLSSMGGSVGDTTRAPVKKRRPQSLYAVSSQIDPPIHKVQSDLLKKPETSILVKSRFFEWSCDYFMEPQMKVIFY